MFENPGAFISCQVSVTYAISSRAVRGAAGDGIPVELDLRGMYALLHSHSL